MKMKTIMTSILIFSTLILAGGAAWAQSMPPGVSCTSGPEVQGDIPFERAGVMDTSALKGTFKTPLATILEGDDNMAAVYVLHIKLQPGACAAWHCHPGPFMICLKKDSAPFHHFERVNHGLREEFEEKIYNPGTCFIEPPFEKGFAYNPSTGPIEFYGMPIVPRDDSKENSFPEFYVSQFLDEQGTPNPEYSAICQ